MTLQECYEKMGGDYAEVSERLVSDERIAKYVVKFLEDPTYQMLCEAIEIDDDKAIFLSIHTLKGLSQNLGFGRLYEASHEMTEAVRGGVKLENMSLFETVRDAYLVTINVIKEFMEGIKEIPFIYDGRTVVEDENSTIKLFFFYNIQI